MQYLPSTLQNLSEKVPPKMATKSAAPVEEKIYECEVKRRRVRAAGGYEPFWKVKTVAEALIDGDTEFRCKHCHGEVKLHKRAATQGGGSHVTHKSKSDSEHCCDAVRVQSAVNGTELRVSSRPVK